MAKAVQHMASDPYTASLLAQQHQKQLHALQQQVLASAAARYPQTQTHQPQVQPHTQNMGSEAYTHQHRNSQFAARDLPTCADCATLPIWIPWIQRRAARPEPRVVLSIHAGWGKNPVTSNGIGAGIQNGSGHSGPLPQRPGAGERTLSKSSSMPDLQSPMSNPAEFLAPTNDINTMPRQAPLPVHSHTHYAQDDNEAMKKWRSEIRNRQDSFALAPDSNSSKMADMPGSFASIYRPMASVLQHSSALQQTLAPERTPSFGGEPAYSTQSRIWIHGIQPWDTWGRPCGRIRLVDHFEQYRRRSG